MFQLPLPPASLSPQKPGGGTPSDQQQQHFDDMPVPGARGSMSGGPGDMQDSRDNMAAGGAYAPGMRQSQDNVGEWTLNGV